MVVYHASGEVYFRTDAIAPVHEEQERLYWEVKGYKVQFEGEKKKGE
jgi:hypothetical protein